MASTRGIAVIAPGRKPGAVQPAPRKVARDGFSARLDRFTNWQLGAFLFCVLCLAFALAVCTLALWALYGAPTPQDIRGMFWPATPAPTADLLATPLVHWGVTPLAHPAATPPRFPSTPARPSIFATPTGGKP